MVTRDWTPELVQALTNIHSLLCDIPTADLVSIKQSGRVSSAVYAARDAVMLATGEPPRRVLPRPEPTVQTSG